MEALTDRQKAILTFMQKHVAKNSYWPSIRDIQAHFKFASTNAVYGHLQALERKGVLERVPGAARAYRIPTSHTNPVYRLAGCLAFVCGLSDLGTIFVG